MALGVTGETPEGQGIRVAVGDQLANLEDESDLGILRQIGIELGDHGRGQIERTAFFIEPVGRLDLAHFLARRHIDAEVLLDQVLFRRAGLEQVDPQRIGE